MKFDEISSAPCTHPLLTQQEAARRCLDGTDGGGGDGGTGGGGGGGGGGGPLDPPECVDPNYAAEHPEECLTAARLIIKPASAILEVGANNSFRAFLWEGGVETELTEGVTFSSNNTGVLVVGARSGNATGVATGIATVTATFGDLLAVAQVEVIADGGCADLGVCFVIVIDNSKSAGQTFSSVNGNRLNFARNAAVEFAETIDLTKDSVAVVSFHSAATVVLEESTDLDDITDAITGIGQTQSSTNLTSGLTKGEELDTDRKRVIVMFTDGEHKEGADPIVYAESIRSTGTLIMVCGLRANSYGFRRLDRIAAGGFFVNALPGNQTDVVDYLSGMKGYVCSGSCEPPGGEFLGIPKLNHDDLINWDILSGHVDLIGKNDRGPGLYDFLPGNDLYLDMAGSTESSGPDLGSLQSKNTFSWVANKTYRIVIRIAGNQRENRPNGDAMTVLAKDADGNVIASATHTITDHTADFAEYELEFTASATSAGRVNVYQSSINGGVGNPTPVFGTLLGRVTVINDTDGVVMLDDTFAGENAAFVPPGCGDQSALPSSGYGGYYAYCYAYGCLDAPVPAQVPDASPLPDLESGGTTLIYEGFAEHTDTCADGTEITEQGEATSEISQEDADAKALLAAIAAVAAAMVCPDTFDTGNIINIQFNDNWQCVNDLGPCDLVTHYEETLSAYRGFAAIGVDSDDWWNQNGGSFDELTFNYDQPAVVADQVGLRKDDETLTHILWSMHTSMVLTGRTLNHPNYLMRTWWRSAGVGTDGDQLRGLIKNLATGTYEIYVYAHGDGDAENSAIQVAVGSFESDGDPMTSGVDCVEKSTVNGAGWESADMVEGMQYVVFRVEVTSGEWVRIISNRDAGTYAYLNGIQIRRIAGSDNDIGIADTDRSDKKCLPFPSKLITDCTAGNINKVTVKLWITHENPEDLDFILEGPDGTHVLLLSNVGTGLTDHDEGDPLILDDEAAATIADGVPIVGGTFKPTQYGSPVATPPSPCPLPTHESALSAFNGKSPNGIWKLFVVDRDPSAARTGEIYNWDLVIT
jgi:hypothetical protein